MKKIYEGVKLSPKEVVIAPIGDATDLKRQLCLDACTVIKGALESKGLYKQGLNIFTSIGDDKWVDVLGDDRKVVHTVMIKITDTVDGSDYWKQLSNEVQAYISKEISNNATETVNVAYFISDNYPNEMLR